MESLQHYARRLTPSRKKVLFMASMLGTALAVLDWETQACPEEPRMGALFLKERNLQ